MKKLLIFLLFALSCNKVFSCHGTNLTLVSGPTAIGGGQYSTVIQVCFAQYTAGNWGGTQNFNLTLTGATYVSFLPATISNSYNAYTTASCAGPNCFMGTCAAISATATGSITSSTVVNYNTTSSTPAGYPLVPDDNESCAGTPTSFCFNFTFVTNGYPTSISLNGNVEVLQPKVCRTSCGFPTNYSGGPCNGSFDADMTIVFSILPIELLYFNGYVNNGFNLLEWTSASELNNNFYSIERSIDGMYWEELVQIQGAGNSSMPLRYTYRDYTYLTNKYNYYRLSQTDYDGTREYFKIISVDNSVPEPPVLVRTCNMYGQEVDEYYYGVVIESYSDGTFKKIMRCPK